MSNDCENGAFNFFLDYIFQQQIEELEHFFRNFQAEQVFVLKS